MALSADDVAVAVASSGSTPFTIGAARAALAAGAFVIAVANVPDAELTRCADVAVVLDSAAEPIMGSTRMRAGLAQRMWLTVFSTAVMVRLGLTHDNLMVNVAPVLEKLRARRLTIACEATGRDPGDAAALLAAAGDDLRVAIVMDLARCDAAAARCALTANGGRTRSAIAAIARR